jgi:hypothetical protein
VTPLLTTVIPATESLAFFPGYGFRDDTTDRWVLRVSGWLYETEQRWRWRRRFIRWLQRGLRLSPTEEQSAILADRLTPFLFKGGRDRTIVVRIAGREYELPPSSETGHLVGTIEVPATDFPYVDGHAWVPFDAATESADGRRFGGRLCLIAPTGLSVVSDLDDTIKHSNVRVRRELLANTFLRPFQAIPGMAARYRDWEDRGATFHYVSNSPWQLTSMLASFLDEETFPRGSMHLRPFRIRRGGIRRFLRASELFKRSALDVLFADLPGRRFVLVGDTSELDPDSYGDLCREHPHRIDRVLIRNVTGERIDDERFQRAFVDVPADRWQVFEDPNGLDGW